MGDFKKAVETVLTGYSDSRKKYAAPLSSFKITFDSPQAQLEPIYYWILDFIKDTGWNTEKVTDNFQASPGSGQFSDMSQRLIQMQEQISNRLGQGINQVIKSVLSLIYDLKEFEIRLEHYKDASSKDPERKMRGLLSLKQIFLDNVDMKKGNGSINVLAGQPGFVTLRDLFYVVNTEEDLQKQVQDGVVNDQVIRVLTPRLAEFWKWRTYSEDELNKRMKIEKNYLKSQVETLKMYSQWLGPYVKAANALQQKGFDKDAALVNAFSTSLFELQLLGIKNATAPGVYGDYKLKRDYHSIVIVGLYFRGHLGQRAADSRGNYAYQFGGRVEMTFDAYALNSEELALVRKEMEKEDIEDVLTNYNFDIAKEAIQTLEKDIEHFLKDPEERITKKEETKKNDPDPFSALFDVVKALFHPLRTMRNGYTELFKGETKKDTPIEGVTDIQKDSYVEKQVRASAAEKAASGLYKIYDIYKKTHGMASSSEDFENENKQLTKEPSPSFSDAIFGKEHR